MTINTPQSILDFCKTFQKRLTLWQRKVIPRMIVSILMSFGNPNYSTMASRVISETRNRSSVSRFFTTNRFNPDDIYLTALTEFLRLHPDQCGGIWFLILDGTATQRGGFAKIGNTTKYKKKTTHQKGGYPSTKAHMFLMGMLLAPNGTRLPLPALPYYTDKYCRKNGIEFKTQVELAAQMITEAPLPLNIKKLIVLADEYYEGQKVHEACAAKRCSYIIPTDSRRCFTDGQGRRTALTLHGRGRHLQRDTFQKIVLVEGQGKTDSYRRLSEPWRKTKRVYRAYTEDRTVSGLGMVRVAYSWKKKKREGRHSCGETFKVLVCNDTTLSIERIVEYYELRWQIELFFRELKSVIGFDRFRGNDFEAFARFVSLVLLSFLYLEWTRIRSMKEKKGGKEKKWLMRARAHGIILHLNNEIDKDAYSGPRYPVVPG